MRRYILFAFAFALGWLCLVRGQFCSGCNPNGKKGCKANGKCDCNPGYAGDKCYDCAVGNYTKDGDKCLALKAYNDTFMVTNIPLAYKCAHDGYGIKFNYYKKIHQHKYAANAKECQEVCKQWANCDIWEFDERDPNNKLCTLVPRDAFQNWEYTKLRISGYGDCPRTEKCLDVDKIYYGITPGAVVQNVGDPFECQGKCEGRAGCTHWTYSMAERTDRACSLFDKGDFGSVATGTTVVHGRKPREHVSGAAECNSCFLYHRKFDRLPRIKHTNGAASVKTDSHFECQEICFANLICIWFEWWTYDKDCFMINPFANLEKRDNVTTGLRDCDLACDHCDVLGLKDPNDKACDKGGNCKCKANYADKLCEHCLRGYTRAADGSCIQRNG